ncbi:3-dehydroquinate synthase [Loigolactobacillus binensis]|uniref:3-dehydroquinate synthase n=1 Tax=Loigolactobacillus binensis TaxID=2559922 RepID=A0ABW3EBL9_9LACO|nr:3-dehydroquinate synthase [Loigolactobacillus binensis]
MQQVEVKLPEKAYPIYIEKGLFAQVGVLVKRQWPKIQQVALISDTNVTPLYAAQIRAQLSDAGFKVYLYTVTAGEASKSLGTASSLYDELLGDGFTRSAGVIALGGGVVGDLAGFVASTYMRGLAFIQIPTSLLAQVDSSVGGKTAVDLPAGKNLVGTFYQPDAVLIDPATLTTLSQRYLVEGYAEVVKMAAIASVDFWQLIEQIPNVAAITSHAEALIKASVAFKARIVMADEKEGGLRQILNFGHTFGHAIEAGAQGALAHGEAVSIGMVTLTQCFEHAGLSPVGTTAKLRHQLAAVGLPLTSALIGQPDFYARIARDKKNRGGRVNMIYLKAIGTPVVYPLALTALPEFVTHNLLEAQ